MKQTTIFDGALNQKGYTCECCGSYVKMYVRKFNSNMAFALLFLYRNQHKGFIHLENEMIAAGHQRCGDASYLRHYGFITAFEGERKDGSKRNGNYRITSFGIMFCEGKIKAAAKFKIQNNKFEGFEGEEIAIQQALGEKFNYSELMGKTETT